MEIKKILEHPTLYMIYALGRVMHGSVAADKLYLKLLYKNRMGKKLNLDSPKTFNEKLQWLKLYDKNPEYSKMVDKYEVKEYVKDKIGEEYIIPTLGVWDSFDDIEFDKLPNQFVLKCTHDSGGLVIVTDKKKMNVEKAKKKINHCLKRNYYSNTREWPYKNVKPRIIAEKYMEDIDDGELRDYKFFCFNGEPKALFIATERATDVKFNYFDIEFNHLNIKQKYPNATEAPHKPQAFEKMLELSKVLSKGIPHVRVDFYEADGKIYFGELTFYHFSGLVPFQPDKWDEIFGNWLELPR